MWGFGWMERRGLYSDEKGAGGVRARERKA